MLFSIAKMMEMYLSRIAELRRQVAEIKEQRKSYLIEKSTKTNSSHTYHVLENAKRRALYSDIELLRMEIEDNIMDEKISSDFSVAAESIDTNQNNKNITSYSNSKTPATPTTPLLPSTITRRTFSDAERGGIPVITAGGSSTTSTSGATTGTGTGTGTKTGTSVSNSAKEMLLEALTAMGNTHPLRS